MADKLRIGAFKRPDGTTSVTYTGTKSSVLDLLALLNAQVLLDVTDNPAQFKEVFDLLQTKTGEYYRVLLLDKVTDKKSTDDFEFLN